MKWSKRPASIAGRFPLHEPLLLLVCVRFVPIPDAGNQGADIEAMREGVLIAVQRQRYNRPIGAKSVQEACAVKTHDRAGKAVVIGTSGFTPAAIEGESPSKRNSDRIEKP